MSDAVIARPDELEATLAEYRRAQDERVHQARLVADKVGELAAVQVAEMEAVVNLAIQRVRLHTLLAEPLPEAGAELTPEPPHLTVIPGTARAEASDHQPVPEPEDEPLTPDTSEVGRSAVGAALSSEANAPKELGTESARLDDQFASKLVLLNPETEQKRSEVIELSYGPNERVVLSIAPGTREFSINGRQPYRVNSDMLAILNTLINNRDRGFLPRELITGELFGDELRSTGARRQSFGYTVNALKQLTDLPLIVTEGKTSNIRYRLAPNVLIEATEASLVQDAGSESVGVVTKPYEVVPPLATEIPTTVLDSSDESDRTAGAPGLKV